MTVVAAGISSAALAQSNVVEKDVEVKTADGTCIAAIPPYWLTGANCAHSDGSAP
jgi:hypothetical protein